MIFLSGVDDIVGTQIPEDAPARIHNPTNPRIGQPPSTAIPPGVPSQIRPGPSGRIPFGPGGGEDAAEGLPFSRTIRPRNIAGSTAVLPAFPVPGAGEEARTLSPTTPIPGPTGRIRSLREASAEDNREYLLSTIRVHIPTLIEFLAKQSAPNRKAILAAVFDLFDLPDALDALNRLTLEYIAKGTQASVAFREALSRVTATNFAVVIPLQLVRDGDAFKTRFEEKYDTKYAPNVSTLNVPIRQALKLMFQLFNKVAKTTAGKKALLAVSAKYGVEGLGGLPRSTRAGCSGLAGCCCNCCAPARVRKQANSRAVGLWDPRRAGLTMPEPAINHGYFVGTSGLGLWEPRRAGLTMPEPVVNRAYVPGVVYDASPEDYPRLKSSLQGLGAAARTSLVDPYDVPKMRLSAARAGKELVDVQAFLRFMDYVRPTATRAGHVRYSALVTYKEDGKLRPGMINEIIVPLPVAEKYRAIMPGLPSTAELQGQAARVASIPEAQIQREQKEAVSQQAELRRQTELDVKWQREFEERNKLLNLMAREAADVAKGAGGTFWQFVKNVVPGWVWPTAGLGLAAYVYIMYFRKPAAPAPVAAAEPAAE